MAYQIHRRTSQYVLVGSDYSQQEPKMLAFVSNDPNMVKAFQEGKDIYALIASLSFNVPYENCLEFHPETGEYQPDGYARRSESKTIVLGITYGRSVKTIGDQLFGDDDSISDKEKITKAQAVYDAVLNAFPNLRSFMFQSQANATKYGYVETILGRRRHIPDMQLPEFDFKPMKGYVNPDIDPLDPSTLENKDDIPERIVNQLKQEYSQYKYNGQIWKRNKQLSEENIRVVNNRSKIGDASRECVNSRIQGSAAELTKMAIIKLINDPRWLKIGGRLLVPIHDELQCEVPVRYKDQGAEILSEDMSSAGDFLPFNISCDVEICRKWFGLSYPCTYTKPTTSDASTWSEDNIKWVQYMLYEQEYLLPLHPNQFEEMRGDTAKGVDGIYGEEMEHYIEDYCKHHAISRDKFLDDIDYRVNTGLGLEYYE